MIRLNEIKSAAQKSGRDMFFAGLGVLSMAEESARHTFETLVEKGRKKRPEKGETSEGVIEKGAAKIKALSTKVTDQVERGFQGTLATFGLPTSKEVGVLSHRIQELTDKVNQLIPAAKKA